MEDRLYKRCRSVHPILIFRSNWVLRLKTNLNYYTRQSNSLVGLLLRYRHVPVIAVCKHCYRRFPKTTTDSKLQVFRLRGNSRKRATTKSMASKWVRLAKHWTSTKRGPAYLRRCRTFPIGLEKRKTPKYIGCPKQTVSSGLWLRENVWGGKYIV